MPGYDSPLVKQKIFFIKKEAAGIACMCACALLFSFLLIYIIGGVGELTIVALLLSIVALLVSIVALLVTESTLALPGTLLR